VALAGVAIEKRDFVVDDPGVSDVLTEIDDLLVGATKASIVGESFDNLVNFVKAFPILEVILFNLTMKEAVGKGK
jgi:hypothetical protein